MIFSIIIINFNTSELTLNCVDSIFLLPNLPDLEIIVVDNGSNDIERRMLTSGLNEKVRLVQSDVNLGFAGGNNLGAKYATGKYLLFLNSDTLLKDNIFFSAEKLFLEDERAGIISPRLLNEDGSYQAKAFGPFPSLKQLIYKNVILKNNNDFPKKIDWVSGAALFIRQDLFKKIGGWDEIFFLYLEDVDLCWMVKEFNYKIILDNSTEIIHLQGRSLSKNRKKQQYYYNSQKYLFRKHYGRFVSIFMILIRWPYKTYSLLKNK